MQRILLLALGLLVPVSALSAAPEKPNVVLIYADDMGIDSVAAFNEALGLPTPHLDRLASEGMSFMDAHSGSGVCTPSRYTLLTGRYHWRSRKKSGIVGQWERPLIEEGRLTIASMLKAEGYHTEMIGKWHLGFDWPKRGGGTTEKLAEIDFTGPITGGPNHRGFDHWFGDDVPNWPPYAWRDNDKLLGEITTTSKALGITSYTGVGNGPAVEGWSLEAVLPEYAKRCSEFVRSREKEAKPFFLYFPMPSPHTPISPNEEWKGKSGKGAYADFLLETDWAVGEVLRALEETGQAENSLVIFTTDNGTSPKADFEGLRKQGTDLIHNWRGNKADAFEGGHRVPFIVRWPGKVAPGSRCDEPISQTDILATVAEVVGYEIPADAAEDSLSLLSLLGGKPSSAPLHEVVISTSVSGLFAVRKGPWKALFCHGSGGWSTPREPDAKKQGLPPVQLYNLETDPHETENVADQHPEILSEIEALLRRTVDEGRSTPGPAQPNHGGVNHWPQLPWKASVAASRKPSETSTKTAWGSIATPAPHQRLLTIATPPGNGRLPLPTPFPHIVSAATAGGQSLWWSFNKDATEIILHLPEKSAETCLLTVAEHSGPLPDGSFVLSALDSKVVGGKAQLETHPGNHRIGFWADGKDQVTWKTKTEIPAGSYRVELIYSRAGKDGATAALDLNGTTLPVDLKSTSSWYVYQVQPIGTLKIATRAPVEATVRSIHQIGPVMNLKAVLLHPATGQ